MNIMRIFGFDNDEDDYEDGDDYTEDRRKPGRKSRESSSRSSSSNQNASGRIVVYNYSGTVPDSDKKRLREAFNDGAMILIDLHNVNQRQFEEEGKDFITFMGGIAFARSGEMKFLEPSQYLLTPRPDMCEIWPEGSDHE